MTHTRLPRRIDPHVCIACSFRRERGGVGQCHHSLISIGDCHTGTLIPITVLLSIIFISDVYRCLSCSWQPVGLEESQRKVTG